MASPAIEFLSRTQRVTVIAETKEEKERIRRTIKNEVEVIVNGRIDLNSFDLKKLISSSSSSSSASFDCILSLLPYTMHHDVCKQAIEMNIPFVTASYVGDLEKLRNLSVQRNVPILCEMGLDPGKMERRKRTTIHKQYYYLGLDILTASKELSEIKQAGLKLTSFESRSVCVCLLIIKETNELICILFFIKLWWFSIPRIFNKQSIRV